MHIPFFFLILLFIGWLAYEIKKNSKQSQNSSKEFWARESESLLTPRRSTEDVVYITVPEEIIPLEIIDASDEDSVRINELSAELKELSSKPVSDLSSYTNTDLRLKYGVPNFNSLWEADNNYARLVQLLPKLISVLMDRGMSEEAGKLLQFCEDNNISTAELTRLKNDFKARI